MQAVNQVTLKGGERAVLKKLLEFLLAVCFVKRQNHNLSNLSVGEVCQPCTDTQTGAAASPQGGRVSDWASELHQQIAGILSITGGA